MGKKVVVAGAGHGGIIAAAHLAKNGYDVTIYERRQREELGYDWIDAIEPEVFAEVGLPPLVEGEFERNGDRLFFNPSLSRPILVKDDGNGSAKIERVFLYNTIIDFAIECGVKFVFGVLIAGPIMKGLRVCGIDTSEGKIYADLVIDSAGVDSPIRKNLPIGTDIRRDYGYGDCFYAYRAYYNRLKDKPNPECNYEVYLVHLNEPGISWNVTEEDMVDVLIGRVIPFDEDKIENALHRMRKHNPQLGKELLRGGDGVHKIPIANPLPVMVCDGLAVIGDAAFMTMPMSGSGITPSLRAGKILAEVVCADENEEYSAKTLWNYNYRYITEIGSAFASIGILKNVMLSIVPEGVDFLFDKEIITSADLAFGRSKGGSLGFADILGRASRGASKLNVLLKTAGGLSKGGNSKEVYKAIPREYDKKAVYEWRESVREAFIPMERYDI